MEGAGDPHCPTFPTDTVPYEREIDTGLAGDGILCTGEAAFAGVGTGIYDECIGGNGDATGAEFLSAAAAEAKSIKRWSAFLHDSANLD